MVVALDGPAGSGKSSVARTLAKLLGAVYVNSGQMYRKVTLDALEGGFVEDPERILAHARTLTWSLGEDSILIDGQRPSETLHTDQVDRHVSRVSAQSALREHINNEIQRMARIGTIIVEGRDMTSVVFPDSPHRFFLDASPRARAQRRLAQGTSDLSLEALQAAIEERDRLDREKKVGALVVAPGVRYLDTSYLTMDEVCAKIRESIQGKANSAGATEEQ